MPIQDVLTEMDKRIKYLEKLMDRKSTQASPINGGDILGSVLQFPMLRAFWPLSSINENGSFIDISGQARHLTIADVPTAGLIGAKLQGYSFDGSDDCAYRADEAGLDITGHITIGCWLKVISLAQNRGIMGKWNTNGNQRSYGMLMNSGGTALNFLISSNGTATFGFSNVDAQVGTWVFTVIRYAPSIDYGLFRNDVYVNTTSSVPASIYNSTAQFELARANVPGVDPTNSNVEIALPFVCAAYIGVANLLPFYNITRPIFGV